MASYINQDSMLVYLKTSCVIELIELFNMMRKSDIESCNITFKQKTVCIQGLNSNKNVLVKTKLFTENFEFYKLDQEKYSIMVNVSSLFDGLYQNRNLDSTILFIDKSNKSRLYVNTYEDYRVLSMEPYCMEPYSMPIPKNQAFDHKFVMDSDKLKNTYEDLLTGQSMSHNSMIKIFFEEDEILFYNPSNRCSKYFTENEDIRWTLEICRPIISHCYDLKNLSCFVNPKISNKTSFFYKNNFPLLNVIKIGDLGKMHVYFSPVTEQSTTMVTDTSPVLEQQLKQIINSVEGVDTRLNSLEQNTKKMINSITDINIRLTILEQNTKKIDK